MLLFAPEQCFQPFRSSWKIGSQTFLAQLALFYWTFINCRYSLMLCRPLNRKKLCISASYIFPFRKGNISMGNLLHYGNNRTIYTHLSTSNSNIIYIGIEQCIMFCARLCNEIGMTWTATKYLSMDFGFNLIFFVCNVLFRMWNLVDSYVFKIWG